jgi:hypothetical protein
MPALLNTRSTWSLACSASSSSRNRSTCASSDTSQAWLVTTASLPDNESTAATFCIGLVRDQTVTRRMVA